MAYNHLQLWGHEASVKMHTACVAEGLSFLHQKGVIHRDIKPRNLLLDAQSCKPGICKIADFGSAKLGNRALTFVGAFEYMAPERARWNDYGAAADWWPLGCVLYELFLGQKVFSEAIEEVRVGIINFDPANLPHMCSSAPGFFIVEEPSRRLPVGSGIRGMRRHCWYCGFQWPKLANQGHSRIQLPKLALHGRHNDQTRGLPKFGCGSAEACKEQAASSKATAKFWVGCWKPRSCNAKWNFLEILFHLWNVEQNWWHWSLLRSCVCMCRSALSYPTLSFFALSYSKLLYAELLCAEILYAQLLYAELLELLYAELL